MRVDSTEEKAAVETALKNHGYTVKDAFEGGGLRIFHTNGLPFPDKTKVEEKRDEFQDLVDMVSGGTGPQVTYTLAEEVGYGEYGGEVVFEVAWE